MSIGSGEAVGGRGIGGEDGRSWFEISTTLCIVSGVLSTGGSFERDFMDGRCICDVSDTQRAGVMAFRRDIRERLKTRGLLTPSEMDFNLDAERKVYCKAL
jgi:hypothetical protein